MKISSTHQGQDYGVVTIAHDSGEAQEFEVPLALAQQLNTVIAQTVDTAIKEREECNGWMNYATWKMNIEFLDGIADVIQENGDTFETKNKLSSYLEHNVLDLLDQMRNEDDIKDNATYGLLVDLAGSFINQASFYEIAEAIASDNPEFIQHGDRECAAYKEEVLPDENGNCSLCGAVIK